MRPEGMVFRQGFRIGDVDHRTRKPAAVQRIDEGFVVELFATPGVNQPCTLWKHPQAFAIQKPRRFVGQRQQANKNIAGRKDRGQSGFAMMAGHAIDLAR